MKNRTRFIKLKLPPRLFYLFANYSAYGLNFLSGLILARNLGAEQRGVLTYITSFYLLTLLIVPLNSRNGSTLASIKNFDTTSTGKPFPFKKIYVRVFVVAIVITVIFDFLLWHTTEKNYLIFFTISNLACSLCFYQYFVEGIFRVEENTLDLAVLRFLGLAIPSFYVLLLFAFDKIEVEFVLLSQFLAVTSCTVFLIRRKRVKVNFSYDEFSEQVQRTFIGFALEYLANIIILLSITLTANIRTIGYFAIALSFVLISETFYPLIESRMLNKINASISNTESVNLSPLFDAIKELIASQSIFLPLAFMIPVVYGDEYSQSVYFALVLIFVKCNYSIVKLYNHYAVISDRFRYPIMVNMVYLLVYVVSFCVLQQLNSSNSWQIASIISSLLVLFIGSFSMRSLRPKQVSITKPREILHNEVF